MATIEDRVTFDLSLDPSSRAHCPRTLASPRSEDDTTERPGEESILQKSRRLILELQAELTAMRKAKMGLEDRVAGLLEEVQEKTREKLREEQEGRQRAEEYEELIESRLGLTSCAKTWREGQRVPD